MKILRQKEFGKFDKQLAERQGISVEALRANRSGFEGTGTVHDSINKRMTESKSFLFPDAESRLNEKAKAKGYNNYASKKANEQLLEEYKDSKALRKGDPTKAYKNFRNTIESRTDARSMRSADLTRSAQQGRINNNSLHTANVSERNRIAEEAKKKVQEQAAKVSEGAKAKSGLIEETIKGNSQKLKEKAKQASPFWTKNKKIAGLALGTAAVGGTGALIYKKKSKKSDNK